MDFNYVYIHYSKVSFTPVFSVTWFIRNLSNMRIWCTRNISHYYQCWK